jgi:hypothetical protein
MTDEELEHMKQTVHDLCGAVLRLQIDLMGKPDLRDQFAMAALPALISDPDSVAYPIGHAKLAYEYADAMMEARK